MKTIKKLTMLCFMIIAILMLGITNVNAVERLPRSGNAVNCNKLEKGKQYFIGYSQDYLPLYNLHCAQKGQRLWSSGITYTLIKHVRIEDNTVWNINKENKRIKSSKYTPNDNLSNLRMAYAVAKLEGSTDQQTFIWGYMDTWLDKGLPKNRYEIPTDFATVKQQGNYKEVKNEIDDLVEEFNVENMEEKLDVNTNAVQLEKIKIKNKDYVRAGPYTIKGIPAKEKIQKFEVVDQNNEKIKDVKFMASKSGVLQTVEYSDIKNNKEFYLCIPDNSGITQFSATIEIKEKETIKKVTADIYFLQSHVKSWQNLVVTKGKIDKEPGKDKDSLDAKIPSTNMPGKVSLIKKDADTGDVLPGAKFVIFYFKPNQETGKHLYQPGTENYVYQKEDKNPDGTKKSGDWFDRIYFKHDGTHQKTSLSNAKSNPDEYVWTTDDKGEINLNGLLPGQTYYGIEIEAPEGYEVEQTGLGTDNYFRVGVGSVEDGNLQNPKIVKNKKRQPDVGTLDLRKVDEDDNNIPLKGIGFRFHNDQYGYLYGEEGNYHYDFEGPGDLYKTGEDGTIHKEGLMSKGNWTYFEDPTTLPYGYDITGKEKGSFKLVANNTQTVWVMNKQKWIKLSGFVWVDKVDGKSGDGANANGLFKTGDLPDGNDLLFDGITVRLKDKRTGQTINETKTAKLDKYTDSGHNGHGEYEFKDVLIEELQYLYIEFEYDGLTYTNVVAQIDKDPGSKAQEEKRKEFNESFSVVEGTGKNTGNTKNTNGQVARNLSYDIQNRTATLNSNGKFEEHTQDSYIEQKNVGQYTITANTEATKYNIKDHLVHGKEEIRNINLGLKEREQPDIALVKDLNNVRLEVNGYGHTYQYAQRFKMMDEDKSIDAFNVGVKFGEKYGKKPYSRAIYEADYEYRNEKDPSKELKAFVTYELKMQNYSSNLKAKINSIVDYFDSEYEITKVGTKLEADGSPNGDIKTPSTSPTNKTEYQKVIIENGTEIEHGKDQSIYIQFKLTREQVARILKDKDVANEEDLLRNVAEINSYSIFDENGVYAGIDKNSNPGNCELGNEDTYENDTSSSPALQLEVAEGARQMAGKVFIDNPIAENGQDPNGIMENSKRQGNGKYDEGEANVKEVEVTLTETSGSGKIYTAKTNDQGDFLIEGYLPGKYTLTYTWGGQTYTLNDQEKTINVQEYKGTIYDSNRKQDNTNWWYVEKDEQGNKVGTDERFTDAIDNYNTAQEAPKGSRQQIDEEMKEITKDTKNSFTRTKMDSTTPLMEIGVEYKTAYTDSMGDKYTFMIDNIDFGIIERAKQNLALTKRISQIKTTLANGQVIADLTLDENGKITGEHKHVTYQEPTSSSYPRNGYVKLELDNELIQGTKLEVSYTIKAENKSEKDYTSEDFYKYGTETGDLVALTPEGIIDYLDNSWAFDNDAYKDTWQVKQVDDIAGMVEETVYKGNETKITKKIILYTDKLKEEALTPGQSKEVTLNVSKLLTTTDEINLENEAEEVKVRKTGGSTIQTIPGNYIPGSGSESGSGSQAIESERNGRNGIEDDDSMAETTIVTPATGDNLNYIIPILIGTTALIILGVGIVIIKKKVIKK